MPAIAPARLAWYALGRFFATASGQAYDVGYFAHLGPIAPLFCGPIGPATAHLTFHAEPFEVSPVPASPIQISADAIGSFSIFYHAHPAANFDDPASFCSSVCVATFRRPFVVLGASVALSSSERFTTNQFSADLVASVPFEHGGQRWDIGELLPHGITQIGTAVAGATPSESNAATFLGSAVAIGGPEKRG